MVRQCQRVARVADRWLMPIHTMLFTVLSVQQVLIQVRTTRQQATHLQWATTTCHKESVSLHPDKMTDPRSVKFMYNKDHAKYNQKYGVK